jgi:hypothetical protein
MGPAHMAALRWHFLRVLGALCGELGSVLDFFNHKGLEEHVRWLKTILSKNRFLLVYLM